MRRVISPGRWGVRACVCRLKDLEFATNRQSETISTDITLRCEQPPPHTHTHPSPNFSSVFGGTLVREIDAIDGVFPFLWLYQGVQVGLGFRVYLPATDYNVQMLPHKAPATGSPLHMSKTSSTETEPPLDRASQCSGDTACVGGGGLVIGPNRLIFRKAASCTRVYVVGQSQCTTTVHPHRP